jgi:hypothetical protein
MRIFKLTLSALEVKEKDKSVFFLSGDLVVVEAVTGETFKCDWLMFG